MDNELRSLLTRLGLPADRMALVQRNVELKVKLESAVRGIIGISEGLHDGFSHPQPFATCDKQTCAASRELVEKLKP